MKSRFDAEKFYKKNPDAVEGAEIESLKIRLLAGWVINRKNNKQVKLNDPQYGVFYLLAKNIDSLVNRDQILDFIYQTTAEFNEYEPHPKTIDTLMSEIRKKIHSIDLSRNTIQTIPSEGFIIKSDEKNSKYQIKFKHFTLDTLTNELSNGKKSVHLQAMDRKMLEILISKPNRIYKKAELLTKIGGESKGKKIINIRACNLRRALKKIAPGSEKIIETITGVGYRYNPNLYTPPTDSTSLPTSEPHSGSLH